MPQPDPDASLVARLRALAPNERVVALEQACAHDPSIRDRLPAIHAALANVEVPAPLPVEAMAHAFGLALERDLEESPGARIGPYKLLEVIGRGGFGVVWMAEQQEPIRRRVALKIVKSGMDTKEVIARFEVERQALALMDHPHIARVFDAGATATGRPYFAMELVRGETITRYCDNNHLPAVERLRLFMAVCHAVQHAHQKGVIHRDLKPSNILVTLHDGVPVPKVIDFGIAKATSGRLTERTLFTHFHAFIGTPAYTSPEQMEMSGLDVDTRSDIYSLGVLLYELLTGCPPFDPETLARSGLEAMRRTIREVDPPLPSQCLTRLPAGDRTSLAQRRGTNAGCHLLLLRGDLDWIVMRCLEKDRRRRYETASELARDVQRHLDSEPVTAGQPSALYVLQKFVRRNRLAFTAVSAVATAVVAGLVIAVWSLRREHVALRQAHLEATRSAQVAQFMKDMLKGIRPQVARGRDATVLREIADQTAVRVERELADEPAVRAELLETLGMVFHDIGEDARAETLLHEALALQRELHGAEHENIARLLHELGEVAVQRGQIYTAERILPEALAMRRRLLGPASPEVAQTLSLLGYARGAVGDDRAGIQNLFEALAIQRAGLGNSDPAVAVTLAHLGRMLEVTGKAGEGETLLREALGINRRALGDEAPETIAVEIALAHVLASLDRRAEAEALCRQILQVSRKVLGNSHPLVVQALISLGNSGLESQGPEAERVFREALAIAQQTESPLAVLALNELCALLNAAGRPADAEDAARQAVAFGREHYRQGDPLIFGDHLATFAVALLAQKHYAEAESASRESLALREAHDPKGWRIVSSQRLVGEALLGQRRFPEAETLLLLSYQTFFKRSAEIPHAKREYLRWTLDSLVELYAQMGRPESQAHWKQMLGEFLASSTEDDWHFLEEDMTPDTFCRWTCESSIQFWRERQRPEKMEIWKRRMAELNPRPAS